MREYSFRLARLKDLPQILALQAVNLEASLAAEEVAEQGFVTVHHDPDTLQAMNDAAPHVVGVSGDEVVGYALVMLRQFADRIPVLQPMFRMFETIGLNDGAGDDRDFFVMGQVCVAKAFRGTGLFADMYAAMREAYAERYRMVVTEIATRNVRSMRAHEKVGFKVIHEYPSEDGEHWAIVAWNWSQR